MKILKFMILFMLVNLLNQPIHSQNWPKIYSGNFHSLISELKETYDRGYIITGFIQLPYGFSRFIYLIKTDINGNILWNKKFGNLIHKYYASNSEITIDNGLIISGATTRYSSGDYDPVFIKTNVCGEIEWCRILTCPDVNYGTDVIQIANSSYIGLLTYYGVDSTFARSSLVKLDQTGEPIWIQRLAQEDSLIYNEEGDHVYLLADSNYLISGQCFHPGLQPLWIKTDTSGFQIWDLFWPGGIGVAYQFVEMIGGNMYSVGSFAETGMPFTPTLYKFDNVGTPITKAYILSDTIDGGEAVPICTYQDTLLLVGIIWGSALRLPVEYYSELFMLDTLGNIVDRRVLLNEDNAPECILSIHDNKVLTAGNYFVDNNFDIYLWKMNAELEDDTLYTQPMVYDSLCPYQITSDTVDLECDIFVNIDEIPTKEEYESTIKISPNPGRDWIMLSLPDNIHDGIIDLAICNLFGQEILKKEVTAVNRTITVNISSLSQGLYVAVCKDRHNRMLKGKFIVVGH